VILDENGEYFIDNLSSTTIPREIRIVKNIGWRFTVNIKADNPLKIISLAKCASLL